MSRSDVCDGDIQGFIDSNWNDDFTVVGQSTVIVTSESVIVVGAVTTRVTGEPVEVTLVDIDCDVMVSAQ